MAGLTGLSLLCHALLWLAAIDEEQRQYELQGRSVVEEGGQEQEEEEISGGSRGGKKI